MKVVLAIDSFKGCLTSIEANQAAAEGVRKACPDVEIVQVPVSDGGEGFLSFLLRGKLSLRGGEGGVTIHGCQDPISLSPPHYFDS